MIKKFIIAVILTTFVTSSLGYLPSAHADILPNLPMPGVMVNPSPAFNPIQLKGIQLYADNPFHFDFLIDKGESQLLGQPLKDEITRLSKYFLTALTVPEADLWVNLSPYEKDRIIPNSFGVTHMGKDLLEQDYLLKQLVASIIYPENDLGRKFWKQVYQKAFEKYGTTEIPISTFNKVWIVPKTAEVYMRGNGAFVTDSSLDVMLEADYVALIKQTKDQRPKTKASQQGTINKNINVETQYLASKYIKTTQTTISNKNILPQQIMRELILPELRKEINEGKNFTIVRQVYNAMILATWYKRHLKNGFISQTYVGQNKVAGVDVKDKAIKQKIYEQYLKSYKKCVYNYIKEDFDPFTQKTVARKYASGGVVFSGLDDKSNPFVVAGFGKVGKGVYHESYTNNGMRLGPSLAMAAVHLKAALNNGRVVDFPDPHTFTSTHPFEQLKGEVGQSVGSRAMIGSTFKSYLPKLTAALMIAVSGLSMTQVDAATSKALKQPVSLEQKIHQERKALNKDILRFDAHGAQALNAQSKLSFWSKKSVEARARQVARGAVPVQAEVEKPTEQFARISTDAPAGPVEIMSFPVITDSNAFPTQDKEPIVVALRLPEPEKSAEVVKDTTAIHQSINNDQGSQLGEVAKDETLANSEKKQEKIDSVGSLRANSDTEKNPNKVAENGDRNNGQQHEMRSDKLENTERSSREPTQPVSYIRRVTNGESLVQEDALSQAQRNRQHLIDELLRQPDPKVQANEAANLSIIKNTQASPLEASSRFENEQGAFSVLMSDVFPSTMTVVGVVGSFLGLGAVGIGLLGSAFYRSSQKSRTGQGLTGQQSVQPAKVTFSPRNGAPPSSVEEEDIHRRLEQDPNAAIELPSKTRVQFVPRQAAPLTSIDEASEAGDILAKMDDIIAVGKNGSSSSDGKHYFRNPLPGWVDTVGLITGLAGAGYAYDLDPTALTVTLFGVPFITRALHAAQVWLHEVVGHAIPAAIIEPKRVKEALSPANLRGNWNLGQWLNLLLPWRSPYSEDPYIHFPSSSNLTIARTGIGVTGLLGLAGLGYLVKLDQTWLMPLIGPMGVTAIATTIGAFLSDRYGSKDGNFACGIVGFGRFGTVAQLAKQNPDRNKERLRRMVTRSAKRGKHSMGAMKGRLNKDGKVEIILEKDMITKFGPGRDLINKVIDRFSKKDKPIDPDTPIEGYVLDMDYIHTRWATSGRATINASHPHIGSNAFETIFSYDFNGNLVWDSKPLSINTSIFSDKEKDEKTLVNAGIGHNGDNDAYQFYKGYRFFKNDEYITDLDKLRQLFMMLTNYKGELPPGDSPPIPLQILYHLTQGNWTAAARFAHTEVNHDSLDEVFEDILNPEELEQVKDFFEKRFLRFARILSRPGLKKNDKTLRDAWVTDEKDVQFKAIAKFKKFLMDELKEAQSNGELPEKVFRRWSGHGGYERSKQFIDVAVERFFIGDRFQATQELVARSIGTYGLFVYVTTDINGFTLVSSNQGVVFGYNKKDMTLGFASDTYAVQEKDSKGNQFEMLVHLNPADSEIFNFHISRQTGDLEIAPYSMKKGGYLSAEELKNRHQRLSKENPYYQDLPPLTDVMDDIKDIPKGIKEARESFDNPTSFNYRSAEEMLKQLVSLWIERQMLSSDHYYRAVAKLKDAVLVLAQKCAHASAGCTESQKEMLAFEGMVPVEQSILIMMIRQKIVVTASRWAIDLMNKEFSEADLPGMYAHEIPQLAQHVIAAVGTSDLVNSWKDRKTKLNSTSNATNNAPDFLIAGEQKSEFIGQIMMELLNSYFTELSVRAINSNLILNYEHEDPELIRARLALIIGDFGSNFNDLNGAIIEGHAIGLKHVFGMASNIGSTLSIVLDQSLNEDADFTRRIFVSGDLRQTEASTYADAVTIAHTTNLVFYLARRMKLLFPTQKPFGLSINDRDIESMEGFKDVMLEDAKRVTGYGEAGNRVKSRVEQSVNPKTGKKIVGDVHELLVKRANKFGNRFLEVPIVNAVFWTYVIGFLTLTGGSGLVSLVTGVTGRPILPFEGIFTLSLGGFILPSMYKLVTGWRHWDRMGPPANMSNVGQKGFFDLERLYYDRLFSLATKSTGSQSHGAEMKTRTISDLAPKMARGSWVSVHLPTGARLRNTARSAIGQLKVSRSSVLGIFKRFLSGAITITTSRDVFNDPRKNISDTNVVIGGAEYMPDRKDPEISEATHRAWDRVIDHFGGFVADKVQFAYITQRSTLNWRTRKSGTFGEAAAATTQTPAGLPSKMPNESQAKESNKAQVAVENEAKVGPVTSNQHNGGVDLRGDLMPLKEKGEINNRLVNFDSRNALTMINGVVPQVSAVVTVTPAMLKIMLGEINHN